MNTLRFSAFVAAWWGVLVTLDGAQPAKQPVRQSTKQPTDPSAKQPAKQPAAAIAANAATRISLVNNRWQLNGAVTYPGTPAEGLLMNVRMVNATFEDLHRADFDPERNADEFVAQIPDYAAHGVRAFTLCLQGGMPDYEGALNSAFAPDGSLREAYLRRVQPRDRGVRPAGSRRHRRVLLPASVQSSSRRSRSARRPGSRGPVAPRARFPQRAPGSGQ